MIANVFEWYEFSIFGFLASFIGKLFFKADHPIIELINAYSVFALSFIARPLGGVFFGMMGDRIGRSASLRLSLILMSVPTILIGLMPTYYQVGMIASVSLLTLRLIQGFAAGGELPTTACYVFEASPTGNRSLLCSVIAISPKLGMLLASLVSFLLVYCFDEQTLLDGAWRIPFLLGIPLTFCIIYLRQSIQEPVVMPTTSPAVTSHDLKWTGLASPIIKAMRLVSFGALYFYAILIWMPTYLAHFLNVSSAIAHSTNTITLCAILPLYLSVHYFSRYFGYRTLLLSSLSFMLLCIVPAFQGLQTYSSWQAILMIQLLLSCIYVGFDGVLIETLGELFPPANRSLGFGFAWTLSAALVGGTTPLVCTYVIHKTGWLMFPAFYLMFFGLLALPVAWGLTKHST
jgi:MHS family proline/betaine transporter-like MFS transporter